MNLKRIKILTVVFLSLIMMLYAVSCAFTGGGVTGGSNASQDIGATQPMPDVPTVDPPADPFTGSGSFTIGSEYFNGSNVMKVNNEIHLLYLEDGGRFTLSSINIGGIGMTTVNTKKGTSAFNESTGVYTLSTDDGEKLYGRYDYESFILCNADGSSVDTVSGRGGNGETAVEIEVRRGNSDYGYRDLANNTNGAAMQGLYRMLRDVYEGFYGSDKDVSITEQGYVIATIPLAELGLSDKEIVSVWKIFGLENPAYYYFNNSVSFIDSEMVLTVDEAYATAAERAKYEADIESMITECGASLEGKLSELDRVMTIHDYIVKEIDYAYMEDGVTPESAAWAHNIVGVSTVKMGVCEAYAKTFHFLCMSNGIESVTLSGYGGEPHAWNLACVDGEWYAFDATWNDTGDNERLSYDCFGLSYSNMTASHTYDTPSQYGLTYLYDLPLISNTDIQLVTLYKDGESLGFCLNIDDAFSRMTDENAEYAVELYDYSYTGPKLLTVPAMKHCIFSERTPNVKKITLKGTYKQSEDGYITLTPIYCVGLDGFTVACDFSIENMEFQMLDFLRFPGIFIENASLSFEGKNCESEVSYIGERNGKSDSVTSEILINSTVTIYSKINVDRLIEETHEINNDRHITLRGDSHIGLIEVTNLALNSGYSEAMAVVIDEYRGLSSDPTLWLKNADLTLGKIIIDKNAEDLYVFMELGKIEELSHVTLAGEMESRLELNVSGKIEYITTDDEGNIIDSWQEEVDPFAIERSFLKLNESIDLSMIDIMFVELKNNTEYCANRTPLYEVDDEWNVNPGKLIYTDDGFVIKGDVLVSYTGNATHIILPSSVKYISDGAFVGAVTLESVVIPEGVVSISGKIFPGCTSMESLSLPSTLKYLDLSALSIDSVKEVTVAYNGKYEDWIRLIARSPESWYGIAEYIKCTDGVRPSRGVSFEQKYEIYISDHSYSGRYNDEDAIIIYFFGLADGKARLWKYTFYGLYFMGESPGDDGISYTCENGVYSLNYNGEVIRVRLTDSGFVFCDSNGAELDQVPSFE